MYHTNAVHVLQPACGVNQLDGSVTPASIKDNPATYELGTIDPFVLLHELVNIAKIHPFGYHRKPVPFQVHTEQRQDVWVAEVSPRDSLSTEVL